MITRNAMMCLVCYDLIESFHTHDFKRCECGNIMVDGGRDYLKRSVKDETKYVDMSESDEEEE